MALGRDGYDLWDQVGQAAYKLKIGYWALNASVPKEIAFDNQVLEPNNGWVIHSGTPFQILSLNWSS
jgi:hypothetical protein